MLLSLQTLLSGVTAPKKLPNISPPDSYDGTIDKSQSFLNSVNLYIEERAAEFTTEASKVLFAVSYMKEGKAKSWVDNLLEGGKLTTLFPTWKKFVDSFKREFSDPLSEETAKRLLKSLRQGTQSVADYVTSFEKYEKKTGYDDTVLREIFEEGLTLALQKRIYELRQMPETLLEWKAKAVSLTLRKFKKLPYEKLTCSWVQAPGGSSRCWVYCI